MKRAYLFPCAILAGVLAFSLWSSAATARHTARWRSQLRLADALAQAEEWPEAVKTLTDSYRDWCGCQTWLHIVFQHDTVDHAETMYCRCIAFAAVRDGGEFRAELADLDAQLALLAETERLSLENVF